MSRIRIDAAAIEAAEIEVTAAESKELEAREALAEQELYRHNLGQAYRQACYEYHNAVSGSGLYMTAYGSSRRHMNKCNAAMDRKEALDRQYMENVEACQVLIRAAAEEHDKAVEKVREAREILRSARRGF